MRFYGNGIVWDAEKVQRLMKFTDGVYETDDPYIIKKLKAFGYKHDNPVKTSPESEEMSAKELRAIAKARGITFKFGATKQDMIDALK